MSTQVKNAAWKNHCSDLKLSVFKSTHLFYKKFIKPKSTDEDLKRREFILNVLLLCSIILFGIGLLIISYQFITWLEFPGLSPVICLVIFLIFLTLYILSRKGFFILSSYIFIGVFFVLTISAVYIWGVDVPVGLLFYVLIIIMSGVLISARFAFVTTIISSLSIITVGYLQINNIVSPNLYWKVDLFRIVDIIATSIIFGIIATVSWLSNREIDKSLKRARKSEAELKQEKDLLEVKVEERTEEVKKVQMEKMTQLYRFAEFGRLSTGLFHDLVNPLTAVSLNIERIEGQPETKEYLDRAIKATKRMENFISAVRKQMSHQESKALFSLTKEIQQAIQILSYKARKADIKVTFSPNENIQMYGDPIKFSQIITNLINNAIDAYAKINQGKKREIEINLKEKNGIINLSVEDWGCGISKEIINKIFQPFFTTKHTEQGTGIGLSLIKGIIEKDFHGNIKVESYENEGSKFIIKFPKIIMNNPIYYLIDQQQEDGGFLDFNKSKSILFTGLILSCLNNLEETDQIKNIKQKAANFLLSQKDDNYMFSENINTNFCILSALMEYNPGIIDGAAIAKVLMILTSLEAKEGGPYYSSKVSNNVDIGVNSNIAYFLSLQNVDLPELNNLIESAIDNSNFKSEFFKSDYPVIYLISKFYKGAQKDKLIDLILNKKELGKWDNPLHTSLTISSLINLGYPIEKLQNEINYLENSDIKPFPLNVAFYMEALKPKDSDTSENRAEISKELTEEERQIYNRMMKIAQERFSLLNGKIKDYATQEIQKTIKGNPDKQMAFMPYFFKKALGEKGKKISDEIVAKLGLANIFFWTSFIIYDDFIDEEGDPKILFTANLYSRESSTIFNNLFPQEYGFAKFFHRLADKVDAAATWETVECRAKINGSKIAIPQDIPDYGNYDMAYDPVSVHVLGSVAMLYYLGYKEDSPEAQNLISYFRNYLIAMQINDDAHDWQEDLRKGHLSTVVVMLLKDYLEKYPNKKEIDIDKELEELQKIFWFKTMVRACETAVWHTDKSRQALKAMTILEDIAPLERFIIITENAAKKGLKEQKTTTDFLKTYKV